MILADKIVSLRKKAGWSQEELAEKLGVTRQSVSKWEGAQSVPDMDKVVTMSRLFGVSTDYLLKDELEEESPCGAAEDDDVPPLRRVSMEQASAYLALRKAAAPKIAAATALCILSPVTLILLSGMSEASRFGISGNAAAGIGLCVPLVLVAIGCLALVTAGVYQGATEQLLEEGDYTRGQKKHHKLISTVTMIYWLTATAVFLIYTYGPSGNGQPQSGWIIWAAAGVLYAAVMGIVRIYRTEPGVSPRSAGKNSKERTQEERACWIFNI